MNSSFASPILLSSDGSPDALLGRVPLSGASSSGAAAYSEDWLQDLLYRHAGALPVGEIDQSYAKLVPVCREMPTNAGPIDVVYLTPDGRPVIVEAKLWRNPEARRKVVGQILDYAKELSRWDFEAFDAAVRRARRADDGDRPKGTLEVLGIPPNSPAAASFHDTLTRTLRRGELMLLIVGDGIREGVGAIADFLEGHGTLHFTFGLVEMAIYAMPNGGQLVQPRVLAQSAIVKRTVVELRDERLSAREPEPPTEPELELPKNVLEARGKAQRFWSGFLAKLRLDDKGQPLGAAANAANQYFYMPKETTAWVSAYTAESSNSAGVYLTFTRGPIADRLYAALCAQREEIDRELGVPASWESDGRKHTIISTKRYDGPFIDSHPGDVQELLADWTNRYVNVFRSRLVQLARETT